MSAELLLREHVVLSATSFAEIVVWKLPRPARGSRHAFKYRLALIANGTCVMRYDNEAGKGDHMHVGDHEVAYEFLSLDRLQKDFWSSVKKWRLTP